MKDAANILLFGKTGVGKSTFVNYFLGEDVARTGSGEPVTQENFVVYECDDGRYPIRIFDTKGLEALDAANQISAIREEVTRRNGSEDVMNWFHTIFFCVSMANPRFEDYEARLLRELRDTLSQHIHIIVTHCDACSEAQLAEMHETILDKLGEREDEDGVRIFDVVSVSKKKRTGQVTKRRGREAVAESVFDLFLSDIADRVSAAYARNLRGSLLWMLDETFTGMDKFVDQNIRWATLFEYMRDRHAVEERLDNAFAALDARIDEMYEITDAEFARILRPIVKLYSSYKGIVTDSYVELSSLALDAALQWTGVRPFGDDFDDGELVARAIPHISVYAEMDTGGMNFGDWLGAIGGTVVDLFSMKRNLKEYFKELRRRYVMRVPTEQELKENAKARILQTFDSVMRQA